MQWGSRTWDSTRNTGTLEFNLNIAFTSTNYVLGFTPKLPGQYSVFMGVITKNTTKFTTWAYGNNSNDRSIGCEWFAIGY